MTYDEEYKIWQSDPEKYWEIKAQNIIWDKNDPDLTF